MASLKAVQERMRSVKSIQKITSAMKMVSAAKFKHDEKRMINGAPFAQAVTGFFDKLPSMDGGSGSDSLPSGKKFLYLPLASDKGLCGGINSAIAKETRLSMVDHEKAGNTTELFCLGNKSSGALKRFFGDRISVSFEECQKVPFNFGMAAAMAERIIDNEPERAFLVSNKFETMMSYETSARKLVTMAETKEMVEDGTKKAEWSGVVDQYNFEPSTYEVWPDLHEFYYGTSVFGAYISGIAAEQSARMAAMENASQNCGEIFDKLTLKFNRARQAKITTELCEIISGASAV